MKLHYFDQPTADTDDISLQMAVGQGYVPPTCLLGGRVVMSEVRTSRDPCAGCAGPREKCHGRAAALAPTVTFSEKTTCRPHQPETGMSSDYFNAPLAPDKDEP